MEYRELKQHLTHAQLTVREFARLVGLNPRSLSNYSPHDVVPMHWAVIVTLISHLAEQHMDYRALLGSLHPAPTPKRPRGKTIQTQACKTTSQKAEHTRKTIQP